jgi:hypothetical protein
MKVEFDTSFYKKLVKIKDKALLEKIKQVILHVEHAKDIQHISSIKKMEGFKTFYRTGLGITVLVLN